MIIYNNGCSHTKEGDSLFSNSYLDIVAKELFNDNFEIYKIEEKERGLFQKDRLELLKHKFISENIIFKNAFYAKSNDLIFFETINFLYTTLNTNLKPDLIIIQLSGPNRRVHSLHNGELLDITPHDNISFGIKFEPFASEQSLQFILILQNLCLYHNINCIFIPYMEFDKTVIHNNFLIQNINTENLTADLINGHRNDFRKLSLARDIHGHPNAKGIYFLAKSVLKKLGKYNIKEIETYFTKEELKDIPYDLDEVNKKFFNELGDGFLKNIKKKLF